MKLLVLTDFHYAGLGQRSPISSRRGDLTLDLIERVRNREENPDAVLCLGDVIDNGRGETAEHDWEDIRQALLGFGVPLVAIPGNHDRIPSRFADVFGEPKAITVTDASGFTARIIPFADSYDERDVCTRDFERMEREFAAVRPDEAVIICQHNTILPEIQSEYPYTPVRYREIADLYAQNKVRLSLSGHFHRGIEAFSDKGVLYACIPALCEAPFGYAVVEPDREKPLVEWKTLE